MSSVGFLYYDDPEVRKWVDFLMKELEENHESLTLYDQISKCIKNFQIAAKLKV